MVGTRTVVKRFGGAPMAAINGTYHENLTPERLDAVLKELGC